MTFKKAQGLGFIIVLLIGVFAVVGVVVGTVNVWEAMACSMGAPLKLSFSPHVGNLKAATVQMNVNSIENVTYEICFDSCSDTSNIVLPAPPNFLELCEIECSILCPINQTCKIWTLDTVYNGRPTGSTSVDVFLFSKKNTGSHEFNFYPNTPTDYQKFEELSMGQQVPTVLSSAYIPNNSVIGAPPLEFNCENGSFIKFEAVSQGQTMVLEETIPHDFCLVPKISVVYSRSAYITFNVTTNIDATCYVAKNDNVPPYSQLIQLDKIGITKITISDIDVEVVSHQIDTIPPNIGKYYLICVSRIDDSAAEVWIDVS